MVIPRPLWLMDGTHDECWAARVRPDAEEVYAKPARNGSFRVTKSHGCTNLRGQRQAPSKLVPRRPLRGNDGEERHRMVQPLVLTATGNEAAMRQAPSASPTTRRLRGYLLLFLFCTCPAMALAADVHSNGTGGGAWSDAATWRTKTVPAADDSVVIAAGDAVEFDCDDSAKVSCKDLALDPDAILGFKPGGKRVLVIAGLIDSYGSIKVTSRDAGDFMELRLTGDAPERIIRLERAAR